MVGVPWGWKGVRTTGRRKTKTEVAPVHADCPRLWFVVLSLGLVYVPLMVLRMEEGHKERVCVLEGMSSLKFEENVESGPVWIHGAPRATSRDPDLGVESSAVALRRRTQYCQWSESLGDPDVEYCFADKSKEQPEDWEPDPQSDCDETEAEYAKKWRSRRVRSAGFDRAAAHHNPQRDPYPSATFVAPEARVGGVGLGAVYIDRLRAPWRPLDFALDSARLETTKVEDFARLAFLPKDVVYVGNGYMYSSINAYTSKELLGAFTLYSQRTVNRGKFARMTQAAIGPECTAGDLRIRLEVKDPAKISAIGIAHQGHLIDGVVDGVLVTAILHAGDASPNELLSAELAHSQTNAFLARTCLAVWALPAVFLFGAFFGVDLTFLWCTAAFSLWAFVSALIFARVWTYAESALLMVAAVFAAALVYTMSPQLDASPGLSAAWRCLARAAGLLPPEGRGEKMVSLACLPFFFFFLYLLLWWADTKANDPFY